MTVSLTPAAVLQFFDNNSVELVGGRLFVYAAGTTTKINVYTDSTGATPFPNPIPLNARGEPDNGSSNTSLGIWITPGTAYKYVLAGPGTDDPPDTPIYTVDNLSTGSATGGQQYVLDTGTTNALAVALTPVPVSYVAGMQFLVNVANTTTGAATVNVNGLGPKSIDYALSGAGPAVLVSGNVYLFVYDGTTFEIVGTPGPGGNWVSNSDLAMMANNTVKGNNTGTTATPQDLPFSALGLNQIAEFANIQASGTNSGESFGSTGTAYVRVLNTTVYNAIPGCSLSTNTIALPAGTYLCQAYAALFYTASNVEAQCRLILYNTTASTNLIVGIFGTADSFTVSGFGYDNLQGTFVLAAPSTIELKHYVTFPSGTLTGGAAVGASGVSETYVDVILTKIA